MKKYVRLNHKFVRHRLIDLDLTVTDLENMLGVSHTVASAWLRKKEAVLPRSDKLSKLVEVLECEIGELLQVVEE